MFLLDVSQTAIASGAMVASIQSLRNTLLLLEKGSHYNRVGIVTFNENIQFYWIRQGNDIHNPIGNLTHILHARIMS